VAGRACRAGRSAAGRRTPGVVVTCLSAAPEARTQRAITRDLPPVQEHRDELAVKAGDGLGLLDGVAGGDPSAQIALDVEALLVALVLTPRVEDARRVDETRVLGASRDLRYPPRSQGAHRPLAGADVAKKIGPRQRSLSTSRASSRQGVDQPISGAPSQDMR
jgi:hypothetical protein